MSVAQNSVQNSAIRDVAAPAALPDKSQRAAILCGCIVAFAYSANYTNHAPLALALMREFSFNQALAGFLTTGIFATHAAMQIPGGHLVDRLGAKRVLFCALAWVMLGNLAIAFAGAYWQLLACKIFTGIGTGVCFVGGARYVHAAAKGPRLNFAQGLFGGSVQLGAGFVILAVPRLNLLAGWRVTFLVSAGMALTAAVIWLAAAPNISSGAAPPGRLGEMLLAPQLWLLGLVQMATFGLSLVVGSWVVVILTRVLKVPATQAGLIGSLVLLLGIVSRPLGGILRRHMGIRSLFIGSLLMIALGWADVRSWALPVAGIAMAFLSVFVLLGIAGRNAGLLLLILAGLAISSLAGAATALVMNLSANPFAALEIAFWLLGSLEDRSFRHVVLSLPFMLAGAAILMSRRSAFRALSLGEETAQSLGVDVGRLRLSVIAGVALGVGGAVAVSGTIGFIGLVAPHLMRPLVGHDPARLLVPSALAGAALLLAADIAVRIIPSTTNIKVGVLTSIIGVPFFLYLIVRERRALGGSVA